MRYQYNYSFLGRWMEANRKISIETILQAIGTTSNNSLRLWEKGRSPMPVTSIMRFCNTFQVPISAFFYDADNTDAYVKPEDGDSFEPEDGYVKERQQGNRGLYDPLDVEVKPSNVPGLISRDASDTEAPSTEIQTAPAPKVATETSRGALLELETRHSAQRDKLLDVIAEQQRQIAELTRQLLAMRKDTRYNAPREYPVSMAAEPDPRR